MKYNPDKTKITNTIMYRLIYRHKQQPKFIELILNWFLMGVKWGVYMRKSIIFQEFGEVFLET